MDHIDIIVIVFSFVIGLLATNGYKAQIVRAIDVLFYGPFLIYVGSQCDNIYTRYFLFVMGASTISYNLKNFIKIWKDHKKSD